ncbi:MAG: radical SAM protein [Tannerella sp.]|nr:radical SAM protein [Tannerella sp.]
MYKLSDYISRGSIMLNNMLFPRHKKLASVMLYATDRCNSRCRHCYIWEKKSKDYISAEQIKKLLNSRSICKNTSIGLEGGEFMLHPQAEAIMEYLYRHHPKFDLLSNGVHTEKLISLVRKYTPARVYISLDGKPETHDYMRRVKGLYPKVIRVIEELKDTAPLSVMFTLTPFNTFEDLRHVASVCRMNRVDMRIGIYNNMEYFQTKEQASEDVSSLNYRIEDIPSVVKEFDENYDFMMLYHLYRNHEVKLSCNSIKDNIVIYPNGDVPLCQNKQIILGNINNESLDAIMAKESTLTYHRNFHQCNECWINFHRKYDIVLYRNLEKVLPRRVICKLLGDYSWSNNPAEKYKDLICKYHKSIITKDENVH